MLGEVNNAAEAFKAAHAKADTDFEPGSIHHTLGRGPLQAAPGNHSHGLNIGAVAVWLGAGSPPVGYLKLNGATINKVDYPDFFAAVGITAASVALPNVSGLMTRVK